MPPNGVIQQPTGSQASNVQKLIKNHMTQQLAPSGNNIDFTNANSAANNPGADLLKQAEGVASQQLTGAIPEDVQAEVMRISAENSIQSGLGTGQAARNITTRDLGLTSLDIQKQGQTAASDIAKIHTQRQQQNQDFLIGLEGVIHQKASIAIAGFQLISQNQQTAQTLANSLIIANSNKKIKGVQGNIDQLLGKKGKPGFFTTTNSAILEQLGIG